MTHKLILVILFLTTVVSAQNKTINSYKYVIVPEKFDFLKEPDKYQTSSLTKFLFNKEGFTALMSNEKHPEDFISNRCNALTARVKDNSGMLTTKLVIELLDCYNKPVFISKEGKSKQKDYKRAYHEAIRKAFESIKALNYTYKEVKQKTIQEPLQSEVKVKQPKQVTEPMLPKLVSSANNDNLAMLYSQAVSNGYQLVNTKPEIVFVVLKTSHPNTFIIKGKDGVFYKKDDIWVAEYYKGDTITTEMYQVKF